jgi:SAM-dependent methyltransferase
LTVSAPEDRARRALESRIARERDFYNEKGATSYHTLRRWIWRALGEFRRNQDITTFYDPAGKVVLDYGCGPGYLTKYMIDHGALHVTGIDVSEGEIEQARLQAEQLGVGDKTNFLAVDAHATGFPQDSFDLIVGSSILHHLDLRVALEEIRRILRPDGRAVFMEPLWHNPLLRLGRALTPSARTPDEHPLTTSDWDLCASIFDNFQHYEREFLTIPLMPFNLIVPTRAQRPLARYLSNLDDRMLARFPTTRKYARITFLILK